MATNPILLSFGWRRDLTVFHKSQRCQDRAVAKLSYRLGKQRGLIGCPFMPKMFPCLNPKDEVFETNVLRQSLRED